MEGVYLMDKDQKDRMIYLRAQEAAEEISNQWDFGHVGFSVLMEILVRQLTVFYEEILEEEQKVQDSKES